MLTMHRLLIVSLVVLLALTFAACGAQVPPEAGPPGSAPSSPAASAVSEPSPSATPQPILEPAVSAVDAQPAPIETRPPAEQRETQETPDPSVLAVPAEAQVPSENSGPAVATESKVLELEVVREVVVERETATAAPAPAAPPHATAMPQVQAESLPAGAAIQPPQAASSVSGHNPPQPQPQPQPGATTFQDYQRSPTVITAQDRVSTFSLDTDRASYRLALNWAREGFTVAPDSVRAEEWINAFDYGYPKPSRADQFAIATEVFRHPLDGGKHLARLSFQAPELRDDGRPLNVTLVLDASGSMGEGNRVAIARAAAESLRQSLRPQDRIAIVHFTDTVIDHLTVAHRRPGAGAVTESIRRLEPHGATNVQAGLNRGVRLADRIRQERPDAYHYVILMSDGVANVDATNPFAILESAGDHRSDNPLRLITIGVGIHNYNDYLLEQLAQHGNGWYRYLDHPDQARATFRRDNWLARSIPFADQTRAQVTWDPAVVRSWRIIGYENRITADELFTQDRKEFAEIPSGAATTVFYELELTGQVGERGAAPVRLGDVALRWVAPASGESRQQQAGVSGHWNRDFDSLNNPLLQLGALVALSADRYSGLPYAGDSYSHNVGWELATLADRLEPLSGDLGQLAAYHDFSFLLEHLTRELPAEEFQPGDSGYSR